MAEGQRFNFGNIVLEWEYYSSCSGWDYKLRLFTDDAFSPIPELNSPDLVSARKKYAELILSLTKGTSFKWVYSYDDTDRYGTEIRIARSYGSEINLVTFMGQVTALFNEQYTRTEGRNSVRRFGYNTDKLQSFVNKDIIDRGVVSIDEEYPNFGYLQDNLNGMILRCPFKLPTSTKLLMLSDDCYLIYYGKYAKIYVLPNESIKVEAVEYDTVKDELELLEADIRRNATKEVKSVVKKGTVKRKKSKSKEVDHDN